MRWTKIIAALILPILGYLSHPIESLVTSHYKLRWFVTADSVQRTATIAIRNAGDTPADPISIALTNPSGEVTDLEYAVPRSGARFSYLNMAMHSEPIRQFVSSPRNRVLLDEHYREPSLKGLENGLEDAILATTVPHSSRHAVSRSQMTLANHLLWLQQCADLNADRHPCCIERAWEKWEYMLRSVQNEVNADWRRDGGLQLVLPDFHLTSTANTRFLASLSPGESMLLIIHVGPSAFRSTFSAQPSPQSVNSIDHLDAGYVKMFLLSPAFAPVIGIILVLATLIPTLPLIPPKFLHTYILVNLALKKRDQMDTAAEWEEVYNRIKYFLKERFDYYRSRLGRLPSDLTSEQLFDFLRADLRLRYQQRGMPFVNSQELGNAIRLSLFELALK